MERTGTQGCGLWREPRGEVAAIRHQPAVNPRKRMPGYRAGLRA